MKSAQLAAQVRISQPFLGERLLFGTSGLPVSKLTVSIRMCISILTSPHVFTAGCDLREARVLKRAQRNKEF
jgi:hypothetical protein